MTELRVTDTSEPSAPPVSWHRWRVAEGSAFEVDDPEGNVGLVQIDAKKFLVERTFRFSDPAVIKMLTDHLVRKGMIEEQARVAVEDARTFRPSAENPTDLASIPRYMRWFESSYGPHTLAAIIHDNLIVKKPNGGALQDDPLSDRFFREMMKSAGVRWVKRWIMWSAVALRSRWAVGGIRRLSVLAWLVLSAAGITAFAWAVVASPMGWEGPVETWAVLVGSLLLPFAAALLWGKQYGAGIIAAIAALWILPAAVLGGIGYLVYLGLEELADRIGLD